jgi:hypothetical protein
MKLLKWRSDATSADTIAKKRHMLEVSKMIKRTATRLTFIIHKRA